uniref:AN1-type zinc finger protein 1-like n=1 Tax=Sinocyclocheilus grahami TaxID=75366 RepID=A0A672L460_SINGR
MKLKMHASGDKGLPQTERTYFQVFLPKEAKDPSLPMFFCSKWSVGKVVDFAASLASLKNNNNVLTAKVSYTRNATLLSSRNDVLKYSSLTI